MKNVKSKQIKVHKDCLAVITMLLLAVCAIAGVLSLNFDHSYEVVNQYGQTVEMYGYGVYTHDTYFQAPISIGSDICILLVLVPMFAYSYFRYAKKSEVVGLMLERKWTLYFAWYFFERDFRSKRGMAVELHIPYRALDGDVAAARHI